MGNKHSLPCPGLTLWTAGAARGGESAESAAERCAAGLALHGRGQWGQALHVFAAAVGDELAAGLTGGCLVSRMHNQAARGVACWLC